MEIALCNEIMWDDYSATMFFSNEKIQTIFFDDEEQAREVEALPYQEQVEYLEGLQAIRSL